MHLLPGEALGESVGDGGCGDGAEGGPDHQSEDGRWSEADGLGRVE